MDLPENISLLDPYTQVYEAWYAALCNSQAIQNIVERIPTNIVSFNQGGGQDQERDILKTADLPELVLRAGNVSANLNAATNLADITREYRVLVTTDTGKIGEKLFPLEWAITCALMKLNFNDILNGLLWNGVKFVNGVKFGGAESGDSDPTNNRGQKGWAAIWRMQVRMNFAQASMKSFDETGVSI